MKEGTRKELADFLRSCASSGLAPRVTCALSPEDRGQFNRRCYAF
jgi:hypothetical protein